MIKKIQVALSIRKGGERKNKTNFVVFIAVAVIIVGHFSIRQKVY